MGRMNDLNIETCENIEHAIKMIAEVKSDLALYQEDESFMDDRGLICYKKLELAYAYLKTTLNLLNWEG